MTTPTPQRFDPCTACEGTMTQSAGGAYVLYTDHAAALAASKAQVDDLTYRLATANAFGEQCMTDINALLQRAEAAEQSLTASEARVAAAIDVARNMTDVATKSIARAEAAEQSLSALQARVDGLEAVVSAHIADLRSCAPLLQTIKGMDKTAEEVVKAANELEAALSPPTKNEGTNDLVEAFEDALQACQEGDETGWASNAERDAAREKVKKTRLALILALRQSL